MSTDLNREGFLEAILGEPMVPDHRLVFADWLEDRGHTEEAAKYRELPGTAALWCKDWGKDGYGLWCELAIRKVVQCLRWIPPGTFQMGSPADEEGRWDREGPRHRVEISRGFWMFDTPCAQAIWEAVMGSNPSRFRGPNRPVDYVSWEDCQGFLAQINSQVRGSELTLPTEAQWEYACRAGTEGPRYAEHLDQIAWYGDNSGDETHPVKEKEPNAWGLYDMLGNVWEWCHDGLRDYSEERVTDPIGPTEPLDFRPQRGGSWYAGRLRAASRFPYHPKGRQSVGIGFRCSMSG